MKTKLSRRGIAEQHASAGPRGIAAAPPAYGIESVDVALAQSTPQVNTPYKTWGAVQQEQEMDKQASQTENNTTQQTSSDVIQGLFSFIVNTNDYTVYQTSYHRIQGTKFLTGNKQYKHVTADSAKDNLWTGMEGMGLVNFGKRVLEIADEYLHLPGLDLLETHKLHDDDNQNFTGINEAMIENYKALDKVMTDIPFASLQLDLAVQAFQNANSTEKKNSAAFLIQNTSLVLIRMIEQFSDLMPLVNIVSGIQNPGSEREAKAFLNTGKTSKNVNSTSDALWAFFDFAAISELVGDNSDETYKQLSESLPWIDFDNLVILVCEKLKLEPQELDISDLINAVAGLMLQNHIKLIKLAYPAKASQCSFGTLKSVKDALDVNDVPVDRKTVAAYAAYGW